MVSRGDLPDKRVLRARETTLPSADLLASALKRVDGADAHAVSLLPGMPTDPQVWADLLLHTPPPVVARLMELHDKLAGLAGIALTDESSFGTLASTADEVLLRHRPAGASEAGADDAHERGSESTPAPPHSPVESLRRFA